MILRGCAGTTPGQVDFDLRPGNGDVSAAPRISPGAMGGRGKVLYDKQPSAQSCGEEVVCEIKVRPVTGAAGHFRPFLIVEYLPETLANLDNLVETA